MHNLRRNYINIDKIISLISSICCYGGSIYMVTILFCQYYDNRDSSQASIKRFHELPTGRYPSFTFCIYAKYGNMFRNETLSKKFGLSKEAYYQILTGERNQTNFAFSNIRFDSAIIGIDDFLEEVEVEDNSYQTYTEWSSAMKDTIGSPFDQSYQDPRTNCFTYNTKYNRSISLYTLKVKFNIPKFQHLFDGSGKIYFQAHYPGTLIRSSKTFLLKLSHWENLKPENSNNQILIQLPGITLMRFRETAEDACDPSLIDDDAKWMQQVAQTIGCTPPYWNDNAGNRSTPRNICRSNKELGQIKAYWPVDEGILAHPIFETYRKPCNKMLIFNNVFKDYENDPDLLKIKCRITEDFYQEILNTRGFGKAELWASIGGYLGVFCGISMHQVTIFLINNIKKCSTLHRI